jgi:hypothetical protein
MDLEEIEQLKTTIRNLPPATQDMLAGMLLMERLKRNKLIMPDIHKRIEDADPENWKTWEDVKKTLQPTERTTDQSSNHTSETDHE